MTEIRILAGLLRDFCKAHLVLAEEGLVDIKGSELGTLCVDPAHVCMSRITLPVNSRDVKVMDPEVRTFDIKKLLACLKFSSYGDEITVSHDGQRIIVKAGKFTYRHSAPDAVAWPKIPNLKCTTAAQIPVDELKKFFKVSESSTVLIELRDEALHFHSGEGSNETELEMPRITLKNVKVDGCNRSLYSKEYLQPIIGLANEEAILEWGHDLPIVVRPKVNNHCINVQPTFYLAPQISNDQEGGTESGEGDRSDEGVD